MRAARLEHVEAHAGNHGGEPAAQVLYRAGVRAAEAPDEIFDEAARHYDEKQLAAIILWIATTNVFNRINVTVRQPADSWGQQAE